MILAQIRACVYVYMRWIMQSALVSRQIEVPIYR